MKKLLLWLMSIIGLTFIFAPLCWGYLDHHAATIVSAGAGMVIFLASSYKALVLDAGKWEYWLAGIAGVVAVVAPFALNYSVEQVALQVSLLLGLITIFVAAYQLLSSKAHSMM